MGHFIALAIKNVFRQKKRSFTLGVNYAVVAFILMLLMAFSRGATQNITANLEKSSAGHITISGQFAAKGNIYNGLLRTDDIISGVKKTFGQDTEILTRYGIRSTAYFRGLSKRLSFTGIDTTADTGFRDQSIFRSGSWADFASDPNGVAVPADVAEYFGLSVGDELVLSTRTRFGAFNTGILVVRGIYVTDNYFARDLMLSHFDFLRSLDLAAADASTSVYVYLPRTDNLSSKRDALAKTLATSGFDVGVPKTDSEAIAAISAASTRYEEDKEGRDRVMLKLATLNEVLGLVRTVLAAVNGVGAFIALVMLFVIAISIFINLRMSINERLREIGTMRAMGVDAWLVTGLFVTESVALAIVFSAAGAVLAVIVAFGIRYGMVFPPGGDLGVFLENGRLALSPSPLAMAAVVSVIAVFAAIFSYFPARRGGAVPPVEALTKTF
jgi:putative ABC transport system permease protein